MLAAARGGRNLLRVLRVCPGWGASKQAHANFFTLPFQKDRRWLPVPSLPLPQLPLPFLKRLGASPHSTLEDDDDLASHGEQEDVDPFSLVAEDMAALAIRLRRLVSADVATLESASEYFFKLGVEGKRFRPMVLLLMASSLSMLPSPDPLDFKTFGDDRRIRQERVAEIVEMIHVATLLHDDVIDNAHTRRGIDSLNVVMGNKLAVLAGDFLLARASMGLSTLRNIEVIALVSQTLEHLVNGEFMQWMGDTQQCCSMDYYLEKTFYKTASLLANSCKSIALLADQPREVALLAFDYGRHLGLAYQLVDDALDFTANQATLGKPALADLREGIATAPILFALEEEPQLLDLIERKFSEEGDKLLVVNLVKKTSGIAKTHALAATHAQFAVDAIARFPPSSDLRAQQCRRGLANLAQSVITRSK